jgi:hypothetical protein
VSQLLGSVREGAWIDADLGEPSQDPIERVDGSSHQV